MWPPHLCHLGIHSHLPSSSLIVLLSSRRVLLHSGRHIVLHCLSTEWSCCHLRGADHRHAVECLRVLLQQHSEMATGTVTGTVEGLLGTTPSCCTDTAMPAGTPAGGGHRHRGDCCGGHLCLILHNRSGQLGVMVCCASAAKCSPLPLPQHSHIWQGNTEGSALSSRSESFCTGTAVLM